MSENELKRLARLANSGFGLGWLYDLHESLEEACNQVSEIQSGLDDLKESLSSGEIKMTGAKRNKLATLFRTVIAFNNRSDREKKAFDAVGLGSCADYDAEVCLQAVKRALSMTASASNRKQ